MRRASFLAWAILAVLLRPAPANAQCANIPLLADGRINTGFDSTTTNMSAFFTPTTGRSYSIEVTLPITTAGTVPFFGFISNTTNCPTANTAGLATVTGHIEPKFAGNGTRWSVIAVNSTAIRVHVPTQPFMVSVSETTLYNPSWSTVGGYFTQWGLQNTTSFTLNGTITVRESYGGSATYTRAVTLPPNVTTFLTTSEQFTGATIPAGRGGSAMFAHDGPPGAVLGDAYLISASQIVPSLFRTMRESLH